MAITITIITTTINYYYYYYYCNIMITRRILDILYSAQHGNQHKDAFA